ncbi:MAG: hypothetical protein Q7R73_01605 [bacterium]|nr:hypothetical protein [bacterium]
MKRTVVVQKWEESERGWGTRPDGYSLHLSDADRKIYIKEYWDSMPDTAPDEYSRPDGTPYPCDVDEEIYEEVKKSTNGIRSFKRAPGSGGIDGWIPLQDGGHGKR